MPEDMAKDVLVLVLVAGGLILDFLRYIGREIKKLLKRR